MLIFNLVLINQMFVYKLQIKLIIKNYEERIRVRLPFRRS